MTDSAIQANLVRELREMTGAGFMDCKQALAEAKGDLGAAKDLLRKKGLAAADKHASREAKDGLIFVQADAKQASMVEVNCETDFVARTDEFQKLGGEILSQVAQKGDGAINLEAILSRVREVSGKLGEKISVRRAVRWSITSGLIASYLHHNKKIGIFIELSFSDGKLTQDPQVDRLGKDLAMQIAALRTPFLSVDDVTPDFLEREKAIFRDQVKDKPENVQEKILQGKIAKRLEEICLLNQKSVLDPSKSISQIVQALGQKLGCPISVKRFQRFEVGVE